MKSLADKKKKQNIGEYILYMYQMEDLIRSYAFNLDDIDQYVITHYPVDEKEKREILHWFGELSHQMEMENIKEKGHLSNVQAEVNNLAQYHWELLKTDKEYCEIYNTAKPYILDFITEANGQDIGHEIQICFNGIYGLLLSRLTGKKVPEDLQSAAEAFGSVLSYLNWVYLEKSQDIR